MSWKIPGFPIALLCAVAATAAEPPTQVQPDLKYLSWRATRTDVVMEYCKKTAPLMQRELADAHRHFMSELLKADQQLKEARKA